MPNDTKMLNLEKVKARLAKIPAQIKADLEAQLVKEANALAASMESVIREKTGTAKSTIKVEDGDNPLSKKVVAGGAATTKPIGKRTYDRDVRVGSGDTKGRKKQAGGKHVTFDYVRALEFEHHTPHGVLVRAHPFFFALYRARKRGMRSRLRGAATRSIKRFNEGG